MMVTTWLVLVSFGPLPMLFGPVYNSVWTDWLRFHTSCFLGTPLLWDGRSAVQLLCICLHCSLRTHCPTVRMPEFLSQSHGPIPLLPCVLLCFLIILCGGLGYCELTSESQQSPGHADASICGTGCWSLPYNTLFPEGLHKYEQGQFVFVRIQGEERFKTLSHVSIICQCYLH